MLFAVDDVVWQSLINGGYTLIGTSFGLYLTYKINKIQALQKVNGEKVEAASQKAILTAQKVDAVAKDQKTHLQAQDETLKKIVEQTNGLTTALVKAASQTAFEAGTKIAQERRITDGLNP